MKNQYVSFEIELDRDVAYQLAQFCKRSTFNTFFDMTEAHLPEETRKERAYQMINGIVKVAAALANAGFDPR